MRLRRRSAGFTLIEILVVVLIIGVITAGVLLSVNVIGRDRELENESDRLLSLVNYAREQAELQTRDYGVLFHQDGYVFLAYDVRRARWREIYEDDSLRLRKLPGGLDFALVVEARPVVLVPTGDVKPDPNAKKPKAKSVNDITSLQDATTATLGHKLGEDSDKLEEDNPITPQVMIFANGDLTSFELTLEREGGTHSVTFTEDEKGQVVAKQAPEHTT
jgi:general secretion pathway protein H